MAGEEDDERAARAARRRENWKGDVVHSHEEMDEADLDFWLAAEPMERVAAVWQLMEELRHLEGDHGPPPRLQRSVGGVRTRGR